MANENSEPTSRSSLTTSAMNEPQQAIPATDVEEKSKIDIEDAGATREEDEEEYISGFRLFAVMFGLSLVAFLIMLDTTIGMWVVFPADDGGEVFSGLSLGKANWPWE